MTCKICGADMPDNEIICPHCGCNNEINSNNSVGQKSIWQPPIHMQTSQKIRLIVEILICTIIIFFGVMIAFFGTVKSCGIMMIIMTGGLFWLLFKNPPISKKSSEQENEATQNKLKLQGKSRIFVIIVCVIAAFIFMFKGIIG